MKQNTLIAFVLVTIAYMLLSQTLPNLSKVKPDKDYDNIYVKQLANDSLQTSFLIWIKKEVAVHYHTEHTENIYVLEGKAKMLLGSDTLNISKGDYFNIPAQTPHGVWVTSKNPLKVLSIQAPFFDGTDRILIK